jgi:predicted TIM-barrel fold metal-dependent hydrolase
VDTHVHLWSASSLPPWLIGDTSLTSIAVDASIADYASQVPNVTHCVYMEVDVAPEDRAKEAAALVALCADPSNRLCGAVIGAPVVDGTVDEFAAWVERWSAVPSVKGVRQVLHPQPAGTCLRDDIVAKAKLAGDFDLVFELCVRADDLKSVAALAAAAPFTRFVRGASPPWVPRPELT